jgi:hypothetical protein
MTTSTERIAQEMAEIRKRIGASQLRRSALDNGNFTVTTPTGPVDSFGNPTPQTSGIVGVQYDGTTTAAVVAGPNPPQPVPPIVVPTINGLEVYYSGAFVNGGVAPMDWARAEIHIAQVSGISGLSALTRKAVIPNANGATINITNLPAGVPHYVAVICWSLAGKPSLVSTVVGPVTPLLMPPSLVDIDFNSLGTHIYYTTGLAPAVTPILGDLWLKQLATGPPPVYETYRWNGTTWVLLADQTATQAAVTAVAAQAAADAKAKLFVQATTPSYSGPAATAYWVDTSASNVTKIWNGSGWTTYQLGNGAIQPNSLVASTVLVTGSVTAALLEAIMIIGNTIVAGDPTGSHARMTPTGFRVFRADPDGTLVPDEVIRMGTDTNDFFGVVNSNHDLVASIDDTGSAAFANLNVAGDLIVKGLDLELYITNSNQPAGSFRAVLPAPSPPSGYGPIRNRVGLAEVNGWLIAGRRYQINWQCAWTAELASGEADFAIQMRSSNTNTASAPVVTDTPLEDWVVGCEFANHWQSATGFTGYTATITGRHRFLLSLARGIVWASDYSVYAISDTRFPVSMDITDQGPAKPFTGQQSYGSGTFFGGSAPAAPATPPTQYDTGWMVPAGWSAFNGSGGVRSDTTGPVQGWDPSGFNGDGSGYWYWNLPSISGTVDGVWVWLYSSHWYYNSGGIARLNLIKNGTSFPAAGGKLTADYDVGGWPKPGSLQVDISGWAGYFHNSQGANRAIGVSVGPIGSTNETYYGRFDGPSARLAIHYTQ